MALTTDAVFITSLDIPSKNITPGRVFSMTATTAAVRIAGGTHRLSTSDEIQAWHDEHSQRAESAELEMRHVAAQSQRQVEAAEFERIRAAAQHRAERLVEPQPILTGQRSLVQPAMDAIAEKIDDLTVRAWAQQAGVIIRQERERQEQQRDWAERRNIERWQEREQRNWAERRRNFERDTIEQARAANSAREEAAYAERMARDRIARDVAAHHAFFDQQRRTKTGDSITVVPPPDRLRRPAHYSAVPSAPFSPSTTEAAPAPAPTTPRFGERARRKFRLTE